MNIDKMRESLSAQNKTFVGSLLPAIKVLKENEAEWAYTRLAHYINDFEADLDNDHEIGARLVSFGQAIAFNIQDMGY